MNTNPAILTGLCLLLTASTCTAPPERDPDRSYALYRVAASSYAANRPEAALGEAEEALKADPQNAEAHNLIGIIALRQGANHISQSQTLDCLHGADADLVHGDAVRRFKEAKAAFRKAAEARDDYGDAWNNLAVAAINLQEWDLAIKAASKALKSGTYSQPFIAQGNRGWAYFQRKDIRLAWKDLHDSVSRQPGFCVGRYRLAKVYAEREQFDEAAEQIEAVAADKRCPIQEAFLLGGMVEKRRQNSDKALTFFDQCVAMAPKSCVAKQCRSYSEMVN